MVTYNSKSVNIATEDANLACLYSSPVNLNSLAKFHQGWSRMTDDGESSTSSSSESDDRPNAKKARYVWQIKGRYHLKGPDEEVDVQRLVTEWQREQVAKAAFDNVVNTVIESMGVYGSLEEEAVEMAIRSHGLQCSCPPLPAPTLPPPVPFHRRPPLSQADFLSQAVAVAIQKKGLTHNG